MIVNSAIFLEQRTIVGTCNKAAESDSVAHRFFDLDGNAHPTLNVRSDTAQRHDSAVFKPNTKVLLSWSHSLEFVSHEYDEDAVNRDVIHWNTILSYND